VGNLRRYTTSEQAKEQVSAHPTTDLYRCAKSTTRPAAMVSQSMLAEQTWENNYGTEEHYLEWTWDGLEITQAIRAKWRRRNFEEEQKEED
jgi:hypothetical protein